MLFKCELRALPRVVPAKIWPLHHIEYFVWIIWRWFGAGPRKTINLGNKQHPTDHESANGFWKFWKSKMIKYNGQEIFQKSNIADPIWKPKNFILHSVGTREFLGQLITTLLSNFENFKSPKWQIECVNREHFYFIFQ